MHGRFHHLLFDYTARAVGLAIAFALLWFFVMLPGVLHATVTPTPVVFKIVVAFFPKPLFFLPFVQSPDSGLPVRYAANCVFLLTNVPGFWLWRDDIARHAA